MIDKVFALPFGKVISEWFYRTSNGMSRHPIKSTAVIAACVWAMYEYDRRYTFGDEVHSRVARTQLVYKMKPRDPSTKKEGATEDDGQADFQVVAVTETPSVPDDQRDAHRSDLWGERDLLDSLDKMRGQVRTQIMQDELQQISVTVEAQNKASFENLTMLVSRSQQAVRRPHWNLRMSERNWSILSRDQQHQQDEYWYRAERSRDDDFSRNTYSGK